MALCNATANVLGVGVHAVNMEQAISCIDRALADGMRGYICVTGVHGVMEAQNDSELKSILNHALLNVPDGMPTVWVGKLQGLRHMGRVFGPELMLHLCRRSVAKGYTHFFYGGAAGVVSELTSSLSAKCPGLKVVGTFTPPFRPLTPEEEADLVILTATLKPDFFWVGLSTPKQEKFMAKYISCLETRLMLGVGAAFDFHAGRIKDAPNWMKQSGLQWLHRLAQEPNRLWRRYATNNPRFVLAIATQFAAAGRFRGLR